MQIKIDKDIPLPTRVNNSHGHKYPLAQLNVGESFFAPVKPSAIYAYIRRVNDQDRRFVVRPENDGARVWRKE